MRCEGYRRDAHDAEKLHSRSPDLCDACYGKQYREEHRSDIQKYQKAYRTGAGYAELQRTYYAQKKPG